MNGGRNNLYIFTQNVHKTIKFMPKICLYTSLRYINITLGVILQPQYLLGDKLS
jgi:hypothetical protein